MTVQTATEKKDTLQNRIDSYGVRLDQLVSVGDSKHKFVVEMKDSELSVDFVFKELIKNVERKSSHS
jgi:metallophosphoesterase superfamily enzyme